MRGGQPVFWAAAAAAVTAVSGQMTDTACGTGPSVAATVFAVLLLLALAALGIVMYQYIWKPRHCPGLEKVVLAENGQQEGRFAFDNPYLSEDDDIGSKSTLPCTDILAIHDKTGTSRSGDFRTPKKHGFCVITPTSSQPRGQSDDSGLSEAEQITIPLKGHDFTGLGFSVQGGMREGIFVSSVSQHGPALESGLVQPGDRVTAVTVSFSQITLEDATAILSQSAPYDVQLHLQKATPGGGRRKTATPPAIADRRNQSVTDITEGNGASLPATRHRKSPETSSPINNRRPSQTEENVQPQKAAVETNISEKEPSATPKETTRLVQRDSAAAGTDSASGGFREMAVDVPEHMDDVHSKRDAEAATDGAGATGAARVRHLGVQVLPLPAAGGASEPRDGRRSVALGVPSLRLATRDTGDGHDVETCLTKLANDQPCSRDLDDETGEPSTPGAEDTEHRRVRMGTSSFKKQERLERRELDDSGLSEAASLVPHRGREGDTDLAVTTAEINAQGSSPETAESGIVPGKDSEETPGLQKTQGNLLPEKQMNEDNGESEVDFKKRGTDFEESTSEEGAPDGDIGGSLDHSAVNKERQRSPSSSSSSISISSSSSPVRERPKQMSFEIPDEMRLAAGAAQDRRSRADRPARSLLPGSTERLADRQESPTEERTPPVALPRTVTPDTGLSDSGEDAPRPEEQGDKLDESLVDSGEDSDKPVEEEELKKTVRSNVAYQDDAASSKVKIDKLEAFKEVLSLTPTASQSVSRKTQAQEVDVVGETVERNHVDRCPCADPAQDRAAPRITGEVTGIVDVGGQKPTKTGPVIVGVTESSRRPAAPASSAAVSRARSEAAALPEALRPTRRRDSGGAAPEPAPRDAAASSGRLCASTGDLTRSEPPRPDSPLGRTVSMQIAGGDSAHGVTRTSAAACDLPQLDLSRVGQQERYGPTLPRRVLSVASSSESVDSEQLPEEVPDAADRSQHPSNHSTNGSGDDDVTTAPPAVPIVLPSEKESLGPTMNGLVDMEENSSEATDGTMIAPPAVPRVLLAEVKLNVEPDGPDERKEPRLIESSASRSPTAFEATTAPTDAPMVPPPVAELSSEPAMDGPDASTGSHPANLSSDAGSPGTEAAMETAPVARSRRGPAPTPPPRSAATRQQPPPPAPAARERDQFEISVQELDSLMISHEQFLRQEAERRAQVCRLAANIRTSREPSPAHESQ